MIVDGVEVPTYCPEDPGWDRVEPWWDIGYWAWARSYWSRFLPPPVKPSARGRYGR